MKKEEIRDKDEEIKDREWRGDHRKAIIWLMLTHYASRTFRSPPKDKDKGKKEQEKDISSKMMDP